MVLDLLSNCNVIMHTCMYLLSSILYYLPLAIINSVNLHVFMSILFSEQQKFHKWAEDAFSKNIHSNFKIPY